MHTVLELGNGGLTLLLALAAVQCRHAVPTCVKLLRKHIHTYAKGHRKGQPRSVR